MSFPTKSSRKEVSTYELGSLSTGIQRVLMVLGQAGARVATWECVRACGMPHLPIQIQGAQLVITYRRSLSMNGYILHLPRYDEALQSPAELD